MKKYFKKSEIGHGKWSDGFSNSKTGKPDKKNKAKKIDDIEVDNDTILLIDEVAEVKSLAGKAKLFIVGKGSLKVNGKKLG